MVQKPITWPLPDEPYCEFCQLRDIQDLELLTDNMSFLEDDGATEVKEKKNILDDSSSSDDPEDFLSESSWILNQYGTNEND